MLPVFTTAKVAYLPSLLLPGERRRWRGETVRAKDEGKIKSGEARREEMGTVACVNRERMKRWRWDIRRTGGSSVERRCKRANEEIGRGAASKNLTL